VSASTVAPPFVTPLTPLAFLGRSAEVYPEKVAVRYGARSVTYRELAAEVTRLAQAFRAAGVQPGDRVAYLMPNVPEMVVAHFAVPLAGGVLVAINTRLAAEEVRYICDHSGASLLVADTGLHGTVAPVAGALRTVREVVSVVDRAGSGAAGAGADSQVGGPTYEEFLGRGSDTPLPWDVADELATIAINYTSGTTGRPKGVMYTHRGAYLNALAEVIHSRHTADSVYLWTLPMFHCNGWCTVWGVTAIGGTHVCLRAVEPALIWKLLVEEGVTHLNCAPTVLVMLTSAAQARTLDRPLVVTTAGAPPSPAIIERMERLGAKVIHVYGLTETYGPHTVCEWQHAWDDAPAAERARLQARQGVAMIHAEPVRVVSSDMTDVPPDGQTLGEVLMRGNNVMKGYYRDPAATETAFAGGWFHSGDLGVRHPDGYVELRDRAKDIIISGAENISTIEVEQAIASHPDVLEVAVIGVPDEKWGERPKAFVITRPGAAVTEAGLIEHVRTRIARFKAPKVVEFVTELPKTSTGKIQKFELRQRAERASST
jgi:fatty-acyl-CoA synthase